MTLLPPEVAHFVNAHRVARLATVDERGRPHVVPVCFVYVEGCVYSVLDAKPKRVDVRALRRVRNLLAQPGVQLLVDRWDEDWSRLAYVQLRGVASLIEAGAEHGEALRLLRQRYVQYESMQLDNAPVIRIEATGYVVWGAIE